MSYPDSLVSGSLYRFYLPETFLFVGKRVCIAAKISFTIGETRQRKVSKMGEKKTQETKKIQKGISDKVSMFFESGNQVISVVCRKIKAYFPGSDDLLSLAYREKIKTSLIGRPLLFPVVSSFIAIFLTYLISFAAALFFLLLFCLFLYLILQGVPHRIPEHSSRVLVWICMGTGLFLSGVMAGDRAHALMWIKKQVLTEPFGISSYFQKFFRAPDFSLPDGEYYVKDMEGVILETAKQNVNSYQSGTIGTESGIKLRFSSRNTSFIAGQSIRFSGILSRPEKKRNPGGFDEADYYARKGIYYRISVSACAQSSRTYSLAWFYRFCDIMQSFTADLFRIWQKVLPQREAALLSGMVTGDTDNMEKPDKDAFSDANLSHLMAVSGSNVTLFLIPAEDIFGRISARRSKKRVFVAVFLLFFWLCDRMERIGNSSNTHDSRRQSISASCQAKRSSQHTFILGCFFVFHFALLCSRFRLFVVFWCLRRIASPFFSGESEIIFSADLSS